MIKPGTTSQRGAAARQPTWPTFRRASALRFRAVSATSATHHRTAPNARPWTSSQGRSRSSTTALLWNRVCRSQARSISGRAAYTAFFCLLASPLQGRFFHVVHFALSLVVCDGHGHDFLFLIGREFLFPPGPWDFQYHSAK